MWGGCSDGVSHVPTSSGSGRPASLPSLWRGSPLPCLGDRLLLLHRGFPLTSLWPGALWPLRLACYLPCGEGFLETGAEALECQERFRDRRWARAPGLVLVAGLDSFVSVHQALVCRSPVPGASLCPSVAHGFLSCRGPRSQPALPPGPTLHVLTLGRKDACGGACWCPGPTQPRSSPPPPCHLLAGVGIAAASPG